MSTNPAIHTAKRGSRWVNIRDGSNREIGAYDSLDEAVTTGRRIARQERVEHIVHRDDGFIHEITLTG